MMSAKTDPQLALMFSFFERLQRQGPGSESSSRRALSLIPALGVECGIARLAFMNGTSPGPIMGTSLSTPSSNNGGHEREVVPN
jgi:hypothetical protein